MLDDKPEDKQLAQDEINDLQRLERNMSCQCFECVMDREMAGDYRLNDEQLRFDCMTGLGFDSEYVFELFFDKQVFLND